MPRRESSLRSAGVVFALALVTLTSACATPSTPVTPPTPSRTEPVVVPPDPTDIAPLRGISVPQGSLTHASISAKIDNHPAARPQIGLERSDIVFEELVEGGLTRYVAVWQSDIPEQLGPVRSIRPMDPDIISPLGGIVAYSGGQERFVQLMRATAVYNAIHGQPDTATTFFRSDAKAAPHNVIVKAQELLAQHTDLAAPDLQFAYSPEAASSTAVLGGTPTASIAYRFSNYVGGSWTWDAATQSFLRAQDGAPDLDTAGTAFAAVNVVVLRVAVTVSQDIPKTELIGAGEAFVSTGGATVHATWSKDASTSQIKLTDDAGAIVDLAPGNTWFELVPLAGSVEIIAPTAG